MNLKNRSVRKKVQKEATRSKVITVAVPAKTKLNHQGNRRIKLLKRRLEMGRSCKHQWEFAGINKEKNTELYTCFICDGEKEKKIKKG